MAFSKVSTRSLLVLTIASSMASTVASAFVIYGGAKKSNAACVVGAHAGGTASTTSAIGAWGQNSKQNKRAPRSVQEKKRMEADEEGRRRSDPRSVRDKKRYDAEEATAKSAAGNKPWNPFRFASQSSKFVPRPFQPKPPKRNVKPGTLLWKPGQNQGSGSGSEFDFEFAPLDDVVMGGASSSNFDQTTGTWRGAVTDANNGGFVGIRNTPNFDWDLSDCGGVELYLRNRSGRPCRFKLGLRDTADFNGFVWSESFDVEQGGGATKVRVPLRKLKPTKFARVIADDSIEPLQRDGVVGLQLVYSKFEYDGNLNPKFKVGDVDLQIIEIRAY